MTQTQLLFGKELEELIITDLENYFLQPKEESIKIEFKSYTHLKANNDHNEKERGVMKTLCAFLNSEGGVVIWGAPVSRKSETGKHICSGPLTSFEKEYQKDEFIAKIANKIIPSPQGILFRSFKVDNKFVYLFDVPKSEFSPHQYNNIYYMRMDGQTVPAPHHYIEALFKKISFPNLECYLRLDSYNLLEKDMAFLNCSLIFCNQSPFQNDFNLQYRIYSSHGAIIKFDESLTGISSRYILKNSGDLLNKQFADTIFYGQWLHDEFKIVLSKETLYDYAYELEIRIQFGARHSPLKICYYKIVIGERMHKKLYDHIVSKTENRLYNVVESEMEKSSKLRLNETLGR